MTVRQQVIVRAAHAIAAGFPNPSFHDWEIVELVENLSGLHLNEHEQVVAVEAFDAAGLASR